LDKVNVFLSYTLRGNDVDYLILKKIKERLEILEWLYVYIDILDNDSINHQERVFEELNRANIVCIIQSTQINNSIWVQKELKHAKQKKIPILWLSNQDIHEILEITSYEGLLQSLVLKKILEKSYC